MRGAGAMDDLKQIEEIVEYEFKDKTLLMEAITHASHVQHLARSRNGTWNKAQALCPEFNSLFNYQRLEYLGDVLMKFLASLHVFLCDPNVPRDVTMLTIRKHKFVENVDVFGRVMYSLEMGKFVRHFDPSLIERECAIYREEEVDADDAGAASGSRDCVLVKQNGSKNVLSDIFESILAAIFIDSGGLPYIMERSPSLEPIDVGSEPLRSHLPGCSDPRELDVVNCFAHKRVFVPFQHSADSLESMSAKSKLMHLCQVHLDNQQAEYVVTHTETGYEISVHVHGKDNQQLELARVTSNVRKTADKKATEAALEHLMQHLGIESK